MGSPPLRSRAIAYEELRRLDRSAKRRDLLSTTSGLSLREGLSTRPCGPRSRRRAVAICDSPALWRSLAPRVAGRPTAGAGEAHGFFRRANQRARLQHALVVLRLEVGVGHHADAGLDIQDVVLDQGGAQHDAGVHRAVGGEVAGAAGIDAAAYRLDLVDDFHGAHLGRARQRARREAGLEGIDRVQPLPAPAPPTPPPFLQVPFPLP